MFGNIGKKVTTSVLSATILGVLAFGWSFTSSGGLVKALGGVSKAEFETALQNNPDPQGPKGDTGLVAEKFRSPISFRLPFVQS
jgi:hypothetical protein